MKHISHWIVVGFLAAPLIAHADTETENESHPHQKVTMDELPAPVKATVQQESQGKQIESMTKEQENGKTVYEIEIVADGKGQEIEISDQGQVLERKPMHEEKTETEHQQNQPEQQQNQPEQQNKY